ncbi:replication initiator protein [Microviridae sp.]|nr:replication initiator protein [Microviridae sp.]
MNNSLNLRHWQLFAKRLRHHIGPYRFYHCGEYGDIYGRPHYHACIFGWDDPDKEYFKQSKSGHPIYTSPALEKVWGKGFAQTGEVTFESAAYCARYIMKKINGDRAEEHYKLPYEHTDPTTGEIHDLEFDLTPEYTTMSRNPGIGLEWFRKYKNDVYPHDEIVINNKKVRPPRFYDGHFEIDHTKKMRQVRIGRKSASQKHASNNTPERLKIREKVQMARLKKLPRTME